MKKVILVAMLGILLVGGYLLISHKPPSTNTPQKSSATKVVCKRFTDLNEAVKNKEIACGLDLSHRFLPPLATSSASLSAVPVSPNLTELPQLTNLTELYLGGNQLGGIPAEVLILKKLVMLDLSDNLIRELPKELSNLTSLQILNLKGNPLSTSEQEKIKKDFPQLNPQF